MGIKYYYSAPQQVRQFTVLTDTNGEILYTYPNSKFIKNLPRVTICSILDGDTLRFGYATCAGKDTFVKRIGQKIAYSRAMKKPYDIINIAGEDIHKISDEIIDEIFELETKRIYQ